MDESTVSDAFESILRETLAQLEEATKSKESLAFYSDIGYVDTKPIRITGIALAEGDWNGVRYTAEEIKAAAKSLEGLVLRVEHSRTREFRSDSVGIVDIVEWDELLKALKFGAKVTCPNAVDLIANGVLKSVSVQTLLERVPQSPGELPIARDLTFVELSLVEVPACNTCNIFHWESLSKKKRAEGLSKCTCPSKVEGEPLSIDMDALRKEIEDLIKTKMEAAGLSYSEKIWNCPVCMEMNKDVPDYEPDKYLTKEELMDHMKMHHPEEWQEMSEAGLVGPDGLIATDDEFVSWSSNRWAEPSEDTKGQISHVDHKEVSSNAQDLSVQDPDSSVGNTEVNDLSTSPEPTPDPKVIPDADPKPAEPTPTPTVPVPVVATPTPAPVPVPIEPAPAPVPAPLVVPPEPVEPKVVERIIERIIERPAVPTPVVVPAPVPAEPVPVPVHVPTPIPTAPEPVLPIEPVPAPVVATPDPTPAPDPTEVLDDLSVGELITLLYRRKETATDE